MIIGSIQDGSPKITLDQDTFKVLASETRIEILKELDKSQLTVSDLSRRLDMSKATLFEHLDKMVRVGLIKKREDHRKWVYYKLSWKGKNILHPERTRIAIVLGIAIVCLIVVSLYFTIAQQEPVTDELAPEIEFIDAEDLKDSSSSKALDDLVIKIEDNRGVDRSSIKIDYTMESDYIFDPKQIINWQTLDYRIHRDLVYVNYPDLDWSNLNDRYFYVRCTVFDNYNNKAVKIYIDYIEEVSINAADLSIAYSDLEIKTQLKNNQLEGIQDILFSLIVHNTGSNDIEDVLISVFIENPDADINGIIDNNTKSMKNLSIEKIRTGQLVKIEFKLTVNMSSINSHLWFFVDPNNNINESNEFNNIVKFRIIPPTNSWSNVVPEFYEWVLITMIILIFLVNLVLKRKKPKP